MDGMLCTLIYIYVLIQQHVYIFQYTQCNSLKPIYAYHSYPIELEINDTTVSYLDLYVPYPKKLTVRAS